MNNIIIDAFHASLREHFEKTGVAGVEELLTFARKLYQLAPIEELAEEPVADVCGLIQSLRYYLDNFDGKRPKVRSFNPGLEEDGWQHGCTQIFILQRDMAFLVDSARMALSRQGLGIHGINSTVLNVERNDQGRLTGWSNEATATSQREALIYFQVDHYGAPARHEAMVAEIHDVLADVATVNGDYPACLARLNELIEGFGAGVASPVEDLDEAIAFLMWMRDNHFTFLAYSYCRLSDDADPLLEILPARNLGLFRQHPKDIAPQRMSDLAPGFRQFHGGDQLLTLTRSSMSARVHRHAYCDYVVVKDLDGNGKLLGEHRFLGLFTSLVYTESPFAIPMVRRKLERIFQRSGLNPAGHYGKVLRQIIEVHPREELFHGSEDQLFDILIGIWQINERRKVRLFVRVDPYEKFVSCMVYFPRDSYRTEIREKTQHLLMAALDAKDCQFSTFFTQSALARTHFVMRICSDRYRELSLADLERQIAGFTNDWHDDLHNAILEHWGDEKGIELSAIYGKAFPVSYQSHFEPRLAVQDIALFDGLRDEGEIATSFFQPQGAEAGTMRFKIFHSGVELSLSRLVPMLENLGFQVIGEHPYPLAPEGRPPVWVHDFTLKFSLDITVDVPGVRQNFVDAFKAVWQGRVDDDAFNWLVIGARLDWRAVALMRLYARYMKQLGIAISQEFIASTLAANLEITRNLVALFKCCFDPKLAGGDGDKSDRGERAKRLESKILEALEGVANLNQDQVLRNYLLLIGATLRTNFFQRNAEGNSKSCIAIKLAPKGLALAPEPRPAFEIFVYSPRFEGVHLRADKIARGGIRWSDRVEDYRTEILGLVKAQQVKNAVIVPAGAKGGFITKKVQPNWTRAQVQDEGKACYQLFMGALLDITDNIQAGAVVPPVDVVRRDGDDTYLVVAADKGTASFSDLANGVSENHDHWLGDAFASGGSNGYDHKKMGITARGAWVAVARHFREIGVDIQKEEFTVVGIGDMSGDVFGNGMLLSRHIRLLAGFNHRAIFIDPNPDAAASFEERQRLFNLPNSSWEDYRRELISAGGGVYPRDAKAIHLTPEIKACFGIEEDVLTPNQLIQKLLLAPVDLIWNGGIGTYVKSEGENHADVGDRANDELRVNGRDLRCKVFGEGGNLGMTQRGRIEFALRGGACNTDFIDNAAGVDCSDHEVNIKIALNQLVRDQDLTAKQRNALLEAMTEDVAAKVLRHNYRQNQALSLALRRSATNPSECVHLMDDLEADGLLKRKLEFLPDDDSLAERQKRGGFLTRPEIAVLLSYSKIYFKRQLFQSAITEDAFISREINAAFPATLVEKFPQAIDNHVLRHEVLCNQLANEIVDVMGMTYVHRLMKATGAEAGDVARAYIIVRELFDLRQVWEEVEKLDFRLPAPDQAKLQLSLMRLGRRTTRWLLRNRRACVDTQGEIATFKPVLQALLAANLTPEGEGSSFAELQALGLSPYATLLIDAASDLYFALGMADVAIRSGADMAVVENVYGQLGEVLQLEWFTEQVAALASATRWEHFARESYMDNLENLFRTLAATLVAQLGEDDLATVLTRWQENHSGLLKRWQDMIRELRGTAAKNFAMVAVALNEFGDLVSASTASSQRP